VLDESAYPHGGLLDFIRPGKSVGNGFSESFNGKLRDESPSANQFLSIEGAKSKIEAWPDALQPSPATHRGGQPEPGGLLGWGNHEDDRTASFQQ
jgi:hypothetical protein